MRYFWMFNMLAISFLYVDPYELVLLHGDHSMYSVMDKLILKG